MSVDVGPQAETYERTQPEPRHPVPGPTLSVTPSGRRTVFRVALVSIAASVSLAIVGALGVVAYGLGTSRVVAGSQVLPPDVRSLTIETGEVPVVVRLTTDDAAAAPRVDMRIFARSDRARLTVAKDGADTQIRLNDSGSNFLLYKGTGEVNVILPPHLARELSVTVNQRAGSLTADADLDQLVAKIDNGTVKLGGSARRVEVKARIGDIGFSTRLAVTESFKATTDFGRLAVEFRTAPRTTEVAALNDVSVGLPGPGPYRVRAASEGPHGQTTVTAPETTDPNAPVVTARSKVGSVSVTEIR